MKFELQRLTSLLDGVTRNEKPVNTFHWLISWNEPKYDDVQTAKEAQCCSNNRTEVFIRNTKQTHTSHNVTYTIFNLSLLLRVSANNFVILREQDQDVPSWFCLQAVSKPVWHIPLLCVQWKTPDDGQRNCPKHVEFHCKIKFWEMSASSWFYYKQVINKLRSCCRFQGQTGNRRETSVKKYLILIHKYHMYNVNI